jgi:hypothetical protein
MYVSTGKNQQSVTTIWHRAWNKGTCAWQRQVTDNPGLLTITYTYPCWISFHCLPSGILEWWSTEVASLPPA